MRATLTMNLQISPYIVYIVILLITMTESVIGQNEAFNFDDNFPQCAHFRTEEVKNYCLEKVCSLKPAPFECEAVKCKLRFPITTLEDKAFRYQCLQESCVSTGNNHETCKDMEECEKIKTGVRGKARFIICISKLFDFVNYEYLLFYI